MIALLAACAAFQLNASMLSPVLVVMGKELKADEVSVSLTQTAFFTSTALFGLFLPRLSDIVGRRRVMIAMLLVMVGGAVLAALAPNLTVLLAARAIQGISGAIIPVCLIVLRSEVSDPRTYGSLMGIVTAVNGGIAGVDAFAGGYLATNFGFRSIFWVIATVGLIAAVLAMAFIPESKPSRDTRMDWPGTASIVASVLALQWAVNEMGKGPSGNWLLIFGLVVFGVAAGLVFWNVEKRVRQPLASPQLLKQRRTWALVLTTTLTMTGVFAAVNGIAMSIAQNEQVGFGLQADTASLWLLTPYALLGWLVGPFSGRLASTLGYRTILQIGLAGSTLGILVLAMFGTHNVLFLVGGILLLGITYAGMGNIMLNGLGVVLSPADNPGFLPGLNSAGFGLGAGLSFAILPAIQASFHGSLDGYVFSLMASALITLCALLVSTLIPKPSDFEVSGK